MGKLSLRNHHSLFLMVICFCLFIGANAQKPTPTPDKPGWTRTTEVTTDNSLTETTLVVDKDKDGYVRTIKETKKFINGTTEQTLTEKTPGGRVMSIEIKKWDSKGKLSTIETRYFDRKGLMSDGWDEMVTYNADGSAISVQTNKITGYVETMFSPKEFVDKINEDQGGSPFFIHPPPPSPDNRIQSCVPRATLSGGYSFLYAGFSNEAETMSGWSAAAQYVLNERFGMVVDFSQHILNKDDQKYNLMNLAAGAQYSFRGKDCHPLVPFAQLLVGAHQQTYSYLGEKLETEKAFSVLMGGGAVYNLGKVGVLAQLHYMPVLWEDEPQHNFRASIGLQVKLDNL